MKKLLIAFSLFLSIFAKVSASSSSLPEQLIEAARQLNRLGLFPATSGNLSARLDEDAIAITVSGKHKGELLPEDIIWIDHTGLSSEPAKKPSAETALHLLIYRLYPETGAVIHTHSVDGTILSLVLYDQTHLVTEGYEIHKAFTGIKTHESRVDLPIFENSQDYAALSKEIETAFENQPEPYGFFLRGHGLYTWGKDVKEAKTRTEAFEFLFHCELRKYIH